MGFQLNSFIPPTSLLSPSLKEQAGGCSVLTCSATQ